MNIPLNLILAIAAVAYGLYWYYRLKVAPEKIEKLQVLIERNDEKMGRAIYVFGHTLLPLIIGLFLFYTYFADK
ncbi:MAG: hypothetical protein AAF353_14335 [Pseudomonadota bacterium]